MKTSKFLIAIGILALSLITSPASAHTVIVSEFPAAESTVDVFPDTISITFAEDLISIGNSNSISASDESGKELTSGKPEISGAVLSIKLDGSEVTGVIKVIYRAVAADGHVIAGDYQFTVSPLVTSETATKTTEEIAPTGESGKKVSVYLIISATLVVGGGLSLFFMWKRRYK